jgi:anti-sigma factor RsiW
MKDEHIKRLLDEAPLSSLGKAELAAVSAHAETCDECRRAFEAARLSSRMLKARTREAFEPSPFFQTRVLAALRERRAAAEERWTFGRLWKSAGLLVSSMAATTAALAVFTFVAPQEQTSGQELASGGTYSAESVIFDEGADEQMTYDQVLTSLYGSEEEAAR